MQPHKAGLYGPYAPHTQPVHHSALLKRSIVFFRCIAVDVIKCLHSYGKDGTSQRGESLQRPQLFEMACAEKTASPVEEGHCALQRTACPESLPASKCCVMSSSEQLKPQPKLASCSVQLYIFLRSVHLIINESMFPIPTEPNLLWDQRLNTVSLSKKSNATWLPNWIYFLRISMNSTQHCLSNLIATYIILELRTEGSEIITY